MWLFWAQGQRTTGYLVLQHSPLSPLLLQTPPWGGRGRRVSWGFLHPVSVTPDRVDDSDDLVMIKESVRLWGKSTAYQKAWQGV